MNGKRILLRLLSFYPPFLGAGIRVRRIENGFESSMRLGLFNRNFFGTHFGGSLYAMCDPFFVLILANRLGEGFVVWDKAASIRFVRPGRGRVRARFEIAPERIEELRQQVEREGKIEPVFTAVVSDKRGDTVATVEKLLYLRRRAAESSAATTVP